MNSPISYSYQLLCHWDALLVVVLSVACMIGFTVWLYHNGYRFFYATTAWLLFLLILSVGLVRAIHEENAYRAIWTELLLGVTRSFVSATESLGHANITRETTMQDPLYLNLRKLHAAWCHDMPIVAYIFTLRLREHENEKVDWIISCESDVNQDGRIAGEREVGEDLYQHYDEWFPIYGQGFAGQTVLEESINSEEYGSFVTAVSPLRDANGSIEAILGVDFRVDRWERMIGQIRAASSQLLAMLMMVYLVAIWSVAFLHRAVMRVTQANRDLVTAKKAGDAAARAKSDFLANMSHEIRTPMNAILGFTDILTQRHVQSCSPQEREESEGILEIIRKSGQDLMTIINDILDFSRIEANLLQIESVPVSIKQVIEDVWQMEMSNVIAKRLDFSVKYKDPIPDLILSDPVRLRQILMNLIGNAIKFTETGSVTVHCETLQPTRSEAGTRSRFGRSASSSSAVGDDSTILRDARDPFPASTILRIDIIDTGIGIDKRQLEHLFQPFTQLDTSSTRRFGGTGLGLSIAKRLAKLMDGDITASSTLHVGSTFTLQLHVYLPTEEQSSAVLEKAKKSGASSSVIALVKPKSDDSEDAKKTISEEKPLRGARILLVEDMLVNQIVIATQLRDAGAKVDVAGNGEEGVQKINEDTDDGLYFDVILMDMQMPVMDGYEATGILRQQGYQRPIIAITAHALTGDREKTIEAGCDDYIAKPVDRNILIATIRKYLK